MQRAIIWIGASLPAPLRLALETSGTRMGVLQARPAFVAFAQRHAARPAAQGAAAIDDALLAAHPHPFMPRPRAVPA